MRADRLVSMPLRAMHRFLRDGARRARVRSLGFNALAGHSSISTRRGSSCSGPIFGFQCPRGPDIDSYTARRGTLGHPSISVSMPSRAVDRLLQGSRQRALANSEVLMPSRAMRQPRQYTCALVSASELPMRDALAAIHRFLQVGGLHTAARRLRFNALAGHASIPTQITANVQVGQILEIMSSIRRAMSSMLMVIGRSRPIAQSCHPRDSQAVNGNSKSREDRTAVLIPTLSSYSPGSCPTVYSRRNGASCGMMNGPASPCHV